MHNTERCVLPSLNRRYILWASTSPACHSASQCTQGGDTDPSGQKTHKGGWGQGDANLNVVSMHEPNTHFLTAELQPRYCDQPGSSCMACRKLGHTHQQGTAPGCAGLAALNTSQAGTRAFNACRLVRSDHWTALHTASRPVPRVLWCRSPQATLMQAREVRTHAQRASHHNTCTYRFQLRCAPSKHLTLTPAIHTQLYTA